MADHTRRPPYRPAYGAVPDDPWAAAAFAEGRRLRSAAERRHARYVHRAERHVERARRRHARALRSVPRRGGVARRLGVGIALLPVAVVMTVITFAVLLAAAAIFVGVLFQIFPFLLLGGAVFVTVRLHLRRRRIRAAGTAPLPARPHFRPAPVDPAEAWQRSVGRFAELQSAYAAHECDAMAVLRLPALSDVSVPSTARFVDAFAEASALESDEFPGEEHARKFGLAVELAERSWRAARAAAERIRLSKLSAAERSTVERVLKLLTTARDSDSEPERLAAYARARAELTKLDAAGVVHLPRLARDHLDAAARGALPS